MKNLFPTVLLFLCCSFNAYAYEGGDEGFEQPVYEETEVFDEAPQAMPLPGVEAKEFDEYEAQESYDAFEPYEPAPEPYDDYGYGGDEVEGSGDYY